MGGREPCARHNAATVETAGTQSAGSAGEPRGRASVAPRPGPAGVQAPGEVRREGRSSSGHCPPSTPCIGASPALKKPLCGGQGASAACVRATGSGAPAGSADVPSACTAESVPWSQRVDSRQLGGGEQPQSPLLWASLRCALRLTTDTTSARVGWETEGSFLPERPWGRKRRGPAGPWCPRNPIIWPPSASTWICLVTLVPFVGPSGSLLGICGPVGLAFCSGAVGGW